MNFVLIAVRSVTNVQ